MKDIKAALFDLYDTLIYVDRKRFEKKVVACAKVCGVTSETFAKTWRSLYIKSTSGVFPRTEDRVEAVLEILQIPSSEKIVNLITQYEHNFLKSGMILFEDAISTLRNLKTSGFKIGLVTNASPSARILIKKHKLDKYVNSITLSSEVKSRKPAKKIYKNALYQLNVSPAKAVFVGDGHDNELTGAQKLGITTIWVKRDVIKYHQRKVEPKINADYTVGTLKDAGEIIITRY